MSKTAILEVDSEKKKQKKKTNSKNENKIDIKK